MKMPTKTYLRPPNDDYAPDINIRLGHIWRDPKDPSSLIGPPLPIPEDIEINHTQKRSWSIDHGGKSRNNIGFWATIALLPVTGGVSTFWDKTQGSTYNIPIMDTYSFEPTPEYIEASANLVSAEMIKRGNNLYIVTGIKIARGGDGSNRESRHIGVDTAIGFDASAAGVPLSVGEQIGYSRGSHNNQSFTSSSDFVFAYRVREIFYHRKKVLKTKEFNKGAVLGEGLTTPDKLGTDDFGFVIENAEVGDDDVTIEGNIYPFIDDDGEESEIVV